MPGCTADEAIAAVVAANAALPQPHPLCIKSDDSDFWQLRAYDTITSSSRSSSSSSSASSSSLQDELQQRRELQQQQQQDASSQEDCQIEHSQQQQQQQHAGESYERQQKHQQLQQQQWLFQCGIKWALCCSAVTMPRQHLHKCALLGKGREDLLQCGTAFGPIPAGLTVIDAAGTPVEGQARPEDGLYLQQFAAFDAAVRSGAVWGVELSALLEWLQQFRPQVGGMCACMRGGGL
jgi:hypothetical protein